MWGKPKETTTEMLRKIMFFLSVSNTGGIIHPHTQLIQVHTGLLLRFKHLKHLKVSSQSYAVMTWFWANKNKVLYHSFEVLLCFLELVSKVKLRFHPILKQIKKVIFRVPNESIASILQWQVCDLGWLNVQNYIFTRLITIFSSHGDLSCFRKSWHVKLQSISGYWRKI